MQCTYRISAHDQPRALARIIQLLDQQMLITHSLVFERRNGEVHIEITIECEPALTNRLAAKLHHQLAIHRVELFTGQPDAAEREILPRATQLHTEA